MRTGAALTLAAALAAAGPSASQGFWGEALTMSDAAPEADVAAGRFVALGGPFGELRIDCVRCHGLDGAGDGSGAYPRLAGQSAWYLYKTLHDYAAGRRPNPIMGPIAALLSDAQMRDAAAWYAAVEDAPWPEPPAAPTRALQLGGALAAGAPGTAVPACATCHGAHGRGRYPVNPALAGQPAPYLAHQLRLWREGRRGGDPMDVMALVARSMTDEQIRAVSLYYAAIGPEPPAAPAVAPPPGPVPAARRAPPPVLPPWLPPREPERGVDRSLRLEPAR
jgi:cytochrome c553